MLKRNIRERKEYIFKKQEEIKQKQIFEKKAKLKQAIDNDKPIPSELKSESKKLLEEIEHDVPIDIDNEYSSKIKDPKILITTSRDASQRLQQFMKELRIIIPNSMRINRGHTVIKDLVRICQEYDFSDLIILHENRGVPDGLILSHMPFGPTIYFGLFNVVLRHDIDTPLETVSEAYPHLIFEGFNTQLGQRIVDILKGIFPVPKPDSSRVLTFINQSDYLTFRHHTFTKNGKDVDLEEVGPRFDLRPYQILLGTVDMPDSNKEWSLRAYTNTARKKNNF